MNTIGRIGIAFGASCWTGMTFPKLFEAVRLLDYAEHPQLFVGSRQLADLACQARAEHAPKWHEGYLTQVVGIAVRLEDMPKEPHLRVCSLRAGENEVLIECAEV